MVAGYSNTQLVCLYHCQLAIVVKWRVIFLWRLSISVTIQWFSGKISLSILSLLTSRKVVDAFNQEMALTAMFTVDGNRESKNRKQIWVISSYNILEHFINYFVCFSFIMLCTAWLWYYSIPINNTRQPFQSKGKLMQSYHLEKIPLWRRVTS